MDLFLDRKLTFEKFAAEVRLSEEPNEWPQQILDELYRQAPFASDYAPRVVLRDVDPDHRYALGQIELLNKMAINPRDDSTPTPAKGTQKSIVPVIIQDGRLKPLDILLSDGKVEPLTDERLRKSMFRPNLFEAIRERPGDMSMIEQLYPPHRQYGGARGPLISDVGAAGVSKEGSVHHEYLMDAILPTIRQDDLLKFAERISEDPSLRAALVTNSATRMFMGKLAKAEPIELKRGDALLKVAHTIKPTVIQIQKIADGFRIKTANPDALIPDSQDMSRPAAVGALGPDMVSKVESDGTATLADQPPVAETTAENQIDVITEFGLYKVKTVGDDRELVGWVFPKVTDLNGAILPLGVFSNGSESSMQEIIVGVPVDGDAEPPASEPSGLGCFYSSGSGSVIALLPMDVSGEIEDEHGTSYDCSTVMGERVRLTKIPMLEVVTPIDEGHYGIPEDCGFLPLTNDVDLAASPDEYTKVAQARITQNAVRVITDGSVYSFEGLPIDKLAGVIDTKFLTRDDAVFLGAILGQEPTNLEHSLIGMTKKGSQEIWFASKPVTLFKDHYGQAKTAAAKFLGGIPDLRVDLVKEATPFEDPAAVDKILSLGFINPENVAIFAGYIPEFESTIRKLSELLMAARMGLHSVEENAVLKAIVHLDKVVAGLKTLESQG